MEPGFIAFYFIIFEQIEFLYIFFYRFWAHFNIPFHSSVRKKAAIWLKHFLISFCMTQCSESCQAYV